MGLIHSKARVVRGFWDLTSLSKSGIQQLWISFNEVSDSFAIDEDAWCEVCWDGREALPINSDEMDREQFNEYCMTPFRVLDTDGNGLIDAFEALGVLCVLSATSFQFRCRFLFTLYDFDSKLELALDELTLLLRTTSRGLSKILQEPLPLVSDVILEELAQNAFKFSNQHNSSCISWDDFYQFALSCPEVAAWLSHFEDIQPWKTSLPQMSSFKIQNTEVEYSHDTIDEELVCLDKRNKKRRFPRNERPWEDTVIETEPTTVMERREEQVPNSYLRPMQVIGYNSECNAKFCGDSMLFACSNLMVKQDILSKTQHFYRGHRGKVTNFKVHSDGLHVASYSILLELLIWNSEKLEPVVDLECDIFSSLIDLSFGGPNNSLIAVLGKSEDDTKNGIGVTIAIFEWAKCKRPLYTTKIASFKNANQLVFSSDTHSTRFAVSSISSEAPVFFDYVQKNTWQARRGIINRHNQALVQRHTGVNKMISRKKRLDSTVGSLYKKEELESEYYDDTKEDQYEFVTCTAAGDLVTWDSCNSAKLISSEKNPIRDMTSMRDFKLVSIGRNGEVDIWTYDLAKVLKTIQTTIMSVSGLHMLDSKLLITSSERGVYMIDLDSETDVVEVLPQLSSSNIAVSKTELIIAESNLIKGFKFKKKANRFEKSFSENNKSKTILNSKIAASDCGDYVAVSEISDGLSSVVLFKRSPQNSKLNEICRVKDFKTNEVSMLKFAPDTSLLVVASSDTKIYVYDLNGVRFPCKNTKDMMMPCMGKVEFSNEANLLSLTKGATQMDFSENVDYIRVGFTEHGMDEQLRFIRLADVKAETNLGIMKDIPWASVSCVYSWGVHGAWPVGSSSKTPLSSVLMKREGTNLLVVGNTDGSIDLQFWPKISRNLGGSRTIYQDRVITLHCMDQVGTLKLCSFNGETVCLWELVDIPDLFWKKQISLVSEEERINLLSVNQMSSFSKRDVITTKEIPKWFKNPAYKNKNTSKQTELTSTLSLEYVHGVTCMRNGLLYVHNPAINKAELVYTSGGRYVVVVDPERHTQRFFTVDAGSITCVVAHEDKICVCDSIGGIQVLGIQSLSSLCSIKTGSSPVQMACMSSKYISCVADHMMIFNWHTGKPLFHSIPCSLPITSISWNPTKKSQLAITGINHISTMDCHDLCYQVVDTLEDDASKSISFTCHTWYETLLIAGDIDGRIYVLDPSENLIVSVVLEAHVESVTCIQLSDNNEIVSSGLDGFVKRWKWEDTILKPIAAIDCGTFLTQKSNCTPGIFSLACSPFGVGNKLRRMSVLNSYAQVLEIHLDTKELITSPLFPHDGPIIQGHIQGEVSLAGHPSGVFCSAAAECFFIWRLTPNRIPVLLSQSDLPSPAFMCAFSHTGSLLAIGMQGTLVALFDVSDLKHAKEISQYGDPGNQKKRGISCIKFSASDALLAVSSNNKLSVFSVKDNKLNPHSTFEQHMEPILAFDISACDKFIKSIDVLGDLKCFSIENENEMKAAPSKKSTVWLDTKVVAGSEMRRFWKEESELPFPVVNAFYSINDSQAIIALSTESGTFRHFAIGNEQEKCYDAHAGPIHHIVGLDKTILTTDVNTGCILEWKRHENHSLDIHTSTASTPDPRIIADDWKEVAMISERSSNEDAVLSVNEGVNNRGGDFQAPDYGRGQITGPPMSSLVLDHVYGFNPAAGGPLINADGWFVIAAGKMVIVWDPLSGHQRHIHSNDGEIKCITMDDDGENLAFIGSSCLILVCDARTGTKLGTCEIKYDSATKEASKVSLMFSPKGHKLCAVSTGDSVSTICLFRASVSNGITPSWSGQSIHTRSWKEDSAPFQLCWIGETCLALIKEHSIHFMPDVSIPNKGKVIHGFESVQNCPSFSASVGLGNKLVVATSGGSLIEFNECIRGKTVADGCEAGSFVTCLSSTYHLDYFVSIDSRGILKVWSSETITQLFTFAHSIDLLSFKDPPSNSFSAVVALRGTKCAVGFVSGEIYTVSLESGAIDCNLQSHQGQVWAMAIRPTDFNRAVTADELGRLLVWDIELKQLLKQCNTGEVPIRALDWSPDGHLIAAGFGSPLCSDKKTTGSFNVINALTMEVMFQGRDSKSWVRDIRFSPDGESLAVACDDGRIYIYAATRGFNLASTCHHKNHSAGILSMDFSLDCSFVRCVDSSYNYQVYTCVSGEPVDEVIRNCKWATHRCHLGWGLQGLWDDTSDVLSCADHDDAIVVSGTKTGDIRAANFPCVQFAQGRVTRHPGHSGCVSRVILAKNVFTTGAHDSSLFVWSVMPK